MLFRSCFTHLSPLLVFGKPFAWWESRKLAYSPVTLAVVFRVGLFSFLSAKLGPVWPKPAPDRAGTGPFPTWGGNRLYGASWGQTGWLGWFCGNCFGAVVFRFQCRKERKGRKIPLEGGRDWCHLPGLSKGCKEAMRTSVLFSLHTICRLFYCPKHKMSNRPLYGTCPLALFLWAPNGNAGRSRKGRNRSQVFSVTCVTGGKGSSVFCEGGPYPFRKFKTARPQRV